MWPPSDLPSAFLKDIKEYKYIKIIKNFSLEFMNSFFEKTKRLIAKPANTKKLTI